MIINKNGLMRLLTTICISFFICILSTVLLVKVAISNSAILKSILLGAGIWLLSEISFELIEKKWAHNIIPSYIALFLIIGIGTVSGLILFGIKSIATIFLICTAAEISGLTIAIISRKKYNTKLNAKLKEFQTKH